MDGRPPTYEELAELTRLFVAAFPEAAPLAGGRPWALMPLVFDAARRGAIEYPCRMAGPPTFGDPGRSPGG